MDVRRTATVREAMRLRSGGAIGTVVEVRFDDGAPRQPVDPDMSGDAVCLRLLDEGWELVDGPDDVPGSELHGEELTARVWLFDREALEDLSTFRM